ncbi:MAG: Asparagine synthase (glutamine-hydrolyzing) [Candidatus Methanohalarchaeum thermophilum]|uniref:Asparagine synthase (Glutamine-hydrolyzing) n=1 Tax=Methanohalarchaeum thermophilum TaxID=1903181 RepID=A0A1Q6DUH2_METT1|nr:MAG: Asparagine synthase (glutamine-hydrolyzing) [Candidatus Methanohalarchaeum thermophilum]
MGHIFGVLGEDRKDYFKAIKQLNNRNSKTKAIRDQDRKISLGINKIGLKNYLEELEEYKSKRYIFNGQLYSKELSRDKAPIIGIDQANTGLDQIDELFSNDSVFSFCYNEENKVYLARDYVGVNPLFYGRDQGSLIFSSNKSSLLKSDLKPIKSIDPGSVYEFDLENLDLQKKQIEKIEAKCNEKNNISIEEISKEILDILDRSIRSRIEKLDEVAIAFSGGIDSSLVAKLADKYTKVNLFTVGMKDSPDFKWSKMVSKELDLEHNIIELTTEKIEEFIQPTIDSIGSANRLDIGVGLPFYILSKNLEERGYDSMVSGQGSDELFGGYDKYKRSDNSKRLMANDIKNMAERNLERDKNVCLSNNIHHLTPFVTKSMIELSLSLPVDLKIGEREKEILRLSAEKILPEKVVRESKRSLQYSSRIDREIDRIARENGFKRRIGHHVDKYLRKKAKDVFNEEVLNEVARKFED